MASTLVFGTMCAATAAPPLQAVPFVFVGTAAECGGPAGSNIVTSAWLGGMGLPDNGGDNGVPATANDPHRGLLLSKNGPTTDCSSAGVVIRHAPRTITELNFDYRKGGHCGAGAPRFNITTEAGFTYFVGCAAGVPTPAPQDPTQWQRVTFSEATPVTPQLATNPPFVFGTTPVKQLAIVFDEGTDSTSAEDPNGVGLAVLDNISVNGQFITSGVGIADGNSGKAHGRNGDDDDD
ncbi:MAG TPA: hypothetical protein VFB20_06555 [Burkholderiales bacterium]|jgi:hypothetical protein|nr:hypothetical protein [Burkholderiales bacterium]